MKWPRINPYARLAFNSVLFFLIIGYAAYSIDIHSFVAGLQKVRLEIYALSVFLTVIYFAGLAVTTHYLMSVLGAQTNYVDIAVLNFVTIFYAHVSQAAGTLYRWISLSGPLGRRGEAAIVIIYERLQSFIICISLLLPVVFVVARGGFAHPFLNQLIWAGLGCLIVFGLGLVLLRPLLKRFTFSFKGGVPGGGWIQRVISDAGRVVEMVRVMSLSQHITAAAPQIICSILILIRFYMLAYSVNEPLSWMAVIVLYCAVRLVEVVPFFVMGIGLQEGVFVFLLPHLGMSGEGAVLFALMHLGNVFILVLMGGALNLLRKRRHA
jgi:uncharacterized membrane protein YbhN (UPF0104 family)